MKSGSTHLLHKDVQKPSPDVQDSSVAARAFRLNGSLTPVDLLVRETIQNSLDAALPSRDVVRVDFRVHKLDSNVNAALIRDFGVPNLTGAGGATLMLEIRDTGTKGLTGQCGVPAEGKLGSEDHLARFLTFSKTHASAGAGGSHGLGKYVMFKFGVGLVMAYSRCLEKGQPVDRLTARWLPNDSDFDARFGEIDPMAIQIRWGRQLRPGSKYRVMALEESADSGGGILKFLRSVGVAPFGKGETGTVFLVPFATRQRCAPDGADLPGQIRKAVVRWYGVRLNNKEYPALIGELKSYQDKQVKSRLQTIDYSQAFLSCRVNGDAVESNEVSRLSQALFKAAVTNKTFEGVICQNIPLSKRHADSEVVVAWCDVPAAALKPWPTGWLFGDEAGSDPVGVLTCMRPGAMAMSWEALDRAQDQAEKVTRLALVLPRSISAVRQLRDAESAEHSTWTACGLGKEIAKNVKQVVCPKPEVTTSRTAGDVDLSVQIGDLLGVDGLGGANSRSLGVTGKRKADKAVKQRRLSLGLVEVGRKFEPDGDIRIEIGDLKSASGFVQIEVGVSLTEWWDGKKWADNFPQLPFPYFFVSLREESAGERIAKIACAARRVLTVRHAGGEAPALRFRVRKVDV
jgi:hypothetical protein